MVAGAQREPRRRYAAHGDLEGRCDLAVRLGTDGPVPAAYAVAAATAARYAALAATPVSLSCGAPLDAAPPAPGETVVDLGCGRGADVHRAAARVGPAGRAVGVDASGPMLASARAGVPAGEGRATFVRADLAAVALSDGFADLVVSTCALNHAADKAAVLREVARLLRPGGRFAISDPVAERPVPDAVRRDPAAWAGCYGGCVTEAELLAAARAAGLDALEVVSRSEPYERGGVLLRKLTVKGRKP
jgi:SAM-dependent methyltransferase